MPKPIAGLSKSGARLNHQIMWTFFSSLGKPIAGLSKSGARLKSPNRVNLFQFTRQTTHITADLLHGLQNSCDLPKPIAGLSKSGARLNHQIMWTIFSSQDKHTDHSWSAAWPAEQLWSAQTYCRPLQISCRTNHLFSSPDKFRGSAAGQKNKTKN
jgi:hypothetical protein